MLTLLVLGIGQYGAWVALVGLAMNDGEAALYGVDSGIFKTATHIGSDLAVAIAATLIECTGHGADVYALASLSAAVLLSPAPSRPCAFSGPLPAHLQIATSPAGAAEMPLRSRTRVP